MRSTIRLGVIAAALLILLSACGDSGSSPTTAPGTASITVTAVDFEFSPDLWSVETGEEVAVTFSNEGSIDHNFVVLTQEITTEEDFTEDLALLILGSAPGGVVNATFTAPAAGTYQVICNVPGHFGAGMVGQINVSG